MGREKRSHAGLAATAKERHKRASKINKAIDRSAPLPPGLVAAKPIATTVNSKHQSYFEFIENKDKKKPLLFEITSNRAPPPGMTYIPIGNPELTERCKEISREMGASVYIVTVAKKDASELSQQIHRVGHHIREHIVEQAMEELGLDTFHEPTITGPDDVEEIPYSQTEINRQADAALRELFPRIPNTDRQQIIDHAFRKGKQFNGEPVVGLQQELSLSRRVQLAVLAHIRHNHTRYDQLLRETTWHNARRATEQLCLDILVKWRGDDENGRNQLDEILREVVVLSDDSDGEDSGEDPDSDSSAVLTDRSAKVARRSAPATRYTVPKNSRLSAAAPSRLGSLKPLASPGNTKKIGKKSGKIIKHQKRNFGRYGAEAAREAARNAAWNSAMQRQHQAADSQANPPGGPSSVSHGAYPESQPFTVIEGPTTVINNGLQRPHSQTRPALGPFTIDEFPEARPLMDASSSVKPMHFPSFHSGSITQKVNKSGNLHKPGDACRGGSRDLPSHQLRDFLHPSIEPKSPDVVHPPSRYKRPLVDYADLRGNDPQYRAQSPPRGPSVFLREGPRSPPRQINHGYSIHAGVIYGGRDQLRVPAASYRDIPQDFARPSHYQPVRDNGSNGFHSRGDRASLYDDQFFSRIEGSLGGKANPILIEDRNMHPHTIVLNSGESVRDRFGSDVEILSVRRPMRDSGPVPQRHPAATVDEGFIRLRENLPSEQRNSLQEEGFLRLREQPPDRMPRQSMPNTNGRSPLDPHRYRLSDASEEAIFVRRADRAPSVDWTHPIGDIQYGERARIDKFVPQDVPSSTRVGVNFEQYPHQQFQERIACDMPVHRHIRPVVGVEDPYRNDRHLPPSGQPHWPHARDNVIVLE